MARRRYELTDREWAIIEPLLPNKPRGVARVSDRRVLNGIMWRFRSGATWAEISERYGPSTTCCNRFVRWRKAGVRDRILAEVSAGYNGELVMIDSTCMRVHQNGATGKKGGSYDRGMGRSRGGLTSKLHALVDADGAPCQPETDRRADSRCLRGGGADRSHSRGCNLAGRQRV